MPEFPELIIALVDALLSLDKLGVRSILAEAGKKFSPFKIIDKLVAPAMEEIGEEWSKGEVSLSQVYMSGQICEEFVSPLISSEGLSIKRQPAIAIAVLEDYHSLGKKIVGAFLRSNGFNLIDYGRMTVEDLARRTIKDNIAILLISTLMLPSALKVKVVRQRLKAEGPSDSKVKIIVGGAPFQFDTELWKEVEADAMGKNAAEAIHIINDMIAQV